MNAIYKLLVPVLIVMLVVVTTLLLKKENILFSDDPALVRDDDDEQMSEPDANIMSGRHIVHIPLAIQEQSNLQLIQLSKAEHRNEIHAFAKVIDIHSLLELKSIYLETKAEYAIAETAQQVSAQEYERLKLLRNEASNISERQLQQARLEWMSSQSRLQTVRIKMDSIKSQIVQGWGQVLSDHILNNSDLAQELFNLESVLLLVTLEGKQLLPANTDTILINVQGNRETARVAHYISPASFVDNRFFGQSYFFHTKADILPAGVYMDAWIPGEAGNTTGILIPLAAVIWYADRPWVYIKTGTDTFVRREVEDYIVTRDGWFVHSGFESGENIVLHGGQMLLSEEFRWSIPDEDDNP